MRYLALQLLFLSFYHVGAFMEGVQQLTIPSRLIRTLYLRSDFSLQELIDSSLDLALANCQNSFKWDRWNCPEKDFARKIASNYLDRESAYVTTLTIAALIYILTKNCTSGTIHGCGCTEQRHRKYNKCSDNPDYAERVITMLLNLNGTQNMDAQAYAVRYNDRTAKTVIRQSLRYYCLCQKVGLPCEENICWFSLPPFKDIAEKVRKMYDNARMVTLHNSGKVIWEHLPEDVLLYVQDSPNYCKVDAVPGWTGTLGRECSRRNDEEMSQPETESCRNLCESCGLQVRGEKIMGIKRCECSLLWGSGVTCKTCLNVEKRFFCY